MKDTPAFPTQESRYPDHPPATMGMTLRDYFAAKTLQGMMASPDLSFTSTAENFANRAYIMADAMLIERSKT